MGGRFAAEILLVFFTLAGAVIGANVAYTADSAGDVYVNYNGTHLNTGTSEPISFEDRSVEFEDPNYPTSLDDRHVFDSTGFESYGKRFTDRLTNAMGRYMAWVADSTATILYPVSDAVPQPVTMGVLNLLTLFGFGFIGYRAYRRRRQHIGGSG